MERLGDNRAIKKPRSYDFNCVILTATVFLKKLHFSLVYMGNILQNMYSFTHMIFATIIIQERYI